MASPDAAGRGQQADSTPLIAGLVLLSVVLCGLFYYKWGGAIRTVAGVHEAGRWTGSADGLTAGGMLRESVFYLRRVWVALVYGLLIGAAVHAFLSPDHVLALLRRSGRGRDQLAAGLVGAPLMLCSCCITPVFQSVYERSARLDSALAIMLGSPGLNPAPIALTFLLFPFPLGLARVAAALAAVFGLAPLLGRAFGPTVTPPGLPPADVTAERAPWRARTAAARFARSLGYITVRTVPLVLAGVALSSLILPRSLELSAGGAVAVVVSIATVSTLVALPTFFEIPLALLFMAHGAPGAAAAMLIAGPIVNLPSLLILGRETRPRVAVALAAGVWLLAVGAGLGVRAVA